MKRGLGMSLAALLMVFFLPGSGSSEGDTVRELRARFEALREEASELSGRLEGLAPATSDPEKRRWPPEAEEISLELARKAREMAEIARLAPDSALALEVLKEAWWTAADALPWDRMPYDHPSRYGGDWRWETYLDICRMGAGRDPVAVYGLLPFLLPYDQIDDRLPLYGRAFYEPALELFETSEDPLIRCLAAVHIANLTWYQDWQLYCDTARRLFQDITTNAVKLPKKQAQEIFERAGAVLFPRWLYFSFSGPPWNLQELVQTSLELYFDANGRYPQETTLLDPEGLWTAIRPFLKPAVAIASRGKMDPDWFDTSTNWFTTIPGLRISGVSWENNKGYYRYRDAKDIPFDKRQPRRWPRLHFVRVSFDNYMEGEDIWTPGNHGNGYSRLTTGSRRDLQSSPGTGLPVTEQAEAWLPNEPAPMPVCNHRIPFTACEPALPPQPLSAFAAPDSVFARHPARQWALLAAPRRPRVLGIWAHPRPEMRGGRVMRPRYHLLAFALAAAIPPLSVSGDLGPCQDPNDPCAWDLLTLFEPVLEFEEDGPNGQRMEYPVDFLSDDADVENNFENPELGGDPLGTVVVAKALPMTDVNGTEFWLLEYHYYFHRNWHKLVPVSNKYTHEHDWEWVYVLAGWYEPLQQYVGYAAVLSIHDDNNREAMEGSSGTPNPCALLDLKGNTYLFPQVVAQGERRYIDPDRRLSKDWIPCDGAECDTLTLLTKAGVKITACGNAMSADVSYPTWQAGAWMIDTDDTWYLCAGPGPEDRAMCYGDPGTCFPWPGCSGHDECDDCEPKRWVPWMRDGLWDNDPIPSDFDFPDTLKIKRKRETSIWIPLQANATEAGWDIQWTWPEAPPASFELLARNPILGWQCRLGQLPHDSTLTYVVHLRASETSQQALRSETGWLLRSPCLTGPEILGGEIELWIRWTPGDEPQRVGQTSLPPPKTSKALLRLQLGPNPAWRDPKIRFFLAREEPVKLVVYDVRGRRVRVVEEGSLPPGWHLRVWDRRTETGQRVGSGVYFVVLRTAEGYVVKRLVLVH
jgi:hypothetical protein